MWRKRSSPRDSTPAEPAGDAGSAPAVAPAARRGRTRLDFVAFLFLGLNVLAFGHAWSMTPLGAGDGTTRGPHGSSAVQRDEALIAVERGRQARDVTRFVLEGPCAPARGAVR